MSKRVHAGLFVVGLIAGVLWAVFARASEPWTKEVLVLQALTNIPRNSMSRGIEIQNRGPNSIFCAIGGNSDGGAAVYPDGGPLALLNKAREITAGSSWSIDSPGIVPLWCLAATADQVTGAATVVSEAP